MKSCVKCLFSRHTSTGGELICTNYRSPAYKQELIRGQLITNDHYAPGFIRRTSKSDMENKVFDKRCVRLAKKCTCYSD
jgi:hypothetical protein